MDSKTFGELIGFSRATPGSYVDVATGLVKTASIDAPRFESKGLLVETQRTNICLNSEALSAGTGTTVTSNGSAAPDGANTADNLVENTSSGEHFAADFSFTPTIGSVYTWSVFAKRVVGSRNIYLRVAAGNVAAVLFDFDTKTLKSPSGAAYVSSGYQELATGYFRIWMSWTASSATSTVCRIHLMAGTVPALYTGDGASSLAIWGRQLEAGDWVSSYIATTSSRSTRATDLAYVDAASWLNNGEGSLLVETAPTTFGVISHSANLGIPSSVLPRVGTYFTTGRIAAAVVSNDAGVLSFLVTNLGPSINPGDFVRQAIAYKRNNFQYSTAGVASATDTDGDLPTISRLTLGFRATNTDHMNGHIKSVKYFPYRLSEAEIKAMTA